MPDVPFRARSSTGWTGRLMRRAVMGALDRGSHNGGCVTEAATTSGLRARAMAFPE